MTPWVVTKTKRVSATFLYNNYVQALDIMQQEPLVERQMAVGNDYVAWREEEEEYLRSLKLMSPEETWKMNYYKRLQQLGEAEEGLSKARKSFSAYDPHALAIPGKRRCNPETVMKNALDKRRRLEEEVCMWEAKYDVAERWMPQGPLIIPKRSLVSQRGFVQTQKVPKITKILKICPDSERAGQILGAVSGLCERPSKALKMLLNAPI